MKVFDNNNGEAGDLLPGVVVDSLCDSFWYYLERDGINLTEENFIENFIAEHGREPKGEDWGEFESDEPTWLLGDWKRDDDGKLDACAGTDGYSAVLQWLGGAPLVTVVAGNYWTRVRSMCSPCCPGQADIDSGYDENGYTCYSLPAEFYREGE